MEQYSDSKVDQDSELEISIDGSSEVNMKYPDHNDNEEIPAGMDIPDPRLASISLSHSLQSSVW